MIVTSQAPIPCVSFSSTQHPMDCSMGGGKGRALDIAENDTGDRKMQEAFIEGQS